MRAGSDCFFSRSGRCGIRSIGALEQLNAHHGFLAARHAEAVAGKARKFDDATFDERPFVNDPHHHRTFVFQMRHPELRAERVDVVSAGQLAFVVFDAAAVFLALKGIIKNRSHAFLNLLRIHRYAAHQGGHNEPESFHNGWF